MQDNFSITNFVKGIPERLKKCISTFATKFRRNGMTTIIDEPSEPKKASTSLPTNKTHIWMQAPSSNTAVVNNASVPPSSKEVLSRRLYLDSNKMISLCREVDPGDDIPVMTVSMTFMGRDIGCCNLYRGDIPLIVGTAPADDLISGAESVSRIFVDRKYALDDNQFAVFVDDTLNVMSLGTSSVVLAEGSERTSRKDVESVLQITNCIFTVSVGYFEAEFKVYSSINSMLGDNFSRVELSAEHLTTKKTKDIVLRDGQPFNRDLFGPGEVSIGRTHGYVKADDEGNFILYASMGTYEPYGIIKNAGEKPMIVEQVALTEGTSFFAGDYLISVTKVRTRFDAPNYVPDHR